MRWFVLASKADLKETTKTQKARQTLTTALFRKFFILGHFPIQTFQLTVIILELNEFL